MRTLVFTPEAYGGVGGIALYNRDLLDALSVMPGGHAVTALPRVIREIPRAVPPSLRFDRSAAKGRCRYLSATFRALVGEFDLVICAHVNLLPLAALAKARFRVPLVLLVYGVDVWEPHPSRLVRRLLGKVDRVVSISDITRQKMCRWSGFPLERVSLLPNAIDLSRYGPGERDSRLVARYGLEGHRVLMTLGRLSALERYKGLDEVLEVLPKLLRSHSDLKYLIVGDGDDRPRLREKADVLGLQQHVVFAGYVPEDEKVAHYRLADAFVMPGRGEGFGFVYLEAMACGVPALGSTLDGSREALLQGELGVLVDPTDLGALERGVLLALERSRSVPAGLDYFSVERFRERLSEILDTV